MVSKWLTSSIRKQLVGSDQQFIFRKHHSISEPDLHSISLYVHIPFCKNMCPYCPYNKIKYDQKEVKPFLEALEQEIALYQDLVGSITVPSLYIGGGTPTTLIDELGTIIDTIKDGFQIRGTIGVETNPSDITEEVVDKLRDAQVNMISLGIQSFQRKSLDFIGRNYDTSTAEHALNLVDGNVFDTVNVDLMFALPGQRVDDVVADATKAMSFDIDQLTFYPLFTFPYSKAGRYLKLKQVRMPHFFSRRIMYKTIHDFCIDQGFDRVSVWGFKKGKSPRYSSVTRDVYIGFGPGAGSYLPGGFYFNTFSVPEYVKTCLNATLPLALKLEVQPQLAKYYWLYWRLYDTIIPKESFWTFFEADRKKMITLLRFFKRCNLIEEKEEYFELTERGCFWIHLLQNYFVLQYIDKVWTMAMNDPWPDEISI